MPAGVHSDVQAGSSNLVNAYRWNELDEHTGLATYSLYAGITDRAMPCESLRANTAFCLDLDAPRVLLSSGQLETFRRGAPVEGEVHKRGIRGAYLVATTLQRLEFLEGLRGGQLAGGHGRLSWEVRNPFGKRRERKVPQKRNRRGSSHSESAGGRARGARGVARVADGDPRRLPDPG